MTGGGILKDTPPLSLTCGNSLMTIIDATTLAQVEPPVAEGVLSQSVGKQGEDSDDLPSYIANSFPVPFTDSKLWDIKDVGIRVPVEGVPIEEAFSFKMCLPFSMFVNDLLEHINRDPGKVHPIGWLNITIFQVACSIARIQATVPLFASLFTAKHRPYDTSLATKGGG
ncbi:hypothetical protein LIER_04459 [Lithospermum erythrorhizon]|uniref:Transposase (putative) gypsy type domain-containing protein n=1 Tax=Lithospermum erythrorhizon TaxID=34254 RepID=A0AAV3NWS9_LITER